MIQLGIIPDYQFSSDARENPYLINPHMKMPPGMTQLTVQPVGPYVNSGDANLQGLGVTMANYMKPAASGAGISGVFDSFWWQKRKWLAIGIVATLGLGIAALAVKVLK